MGTNICVGGVHAAAAVPVDGGAAVAVDGSTAITDKDYNVGQVIMPPGHKKI